MREHYANGDEITLKHNNCDGCSPSSINGVFCHEQGCPDAWRDNVTECEEEQEPDEPDECHHEPDMNSVTLERDGHGIYLDVNCKHCGISGCFGRFVESDEVDW